MAQLLFFDDKHEYVLDGELIPSVSELARFCSREIYSNINQYTLDNACDRGTKVHKACENIDLFGECEVDAEISGYVNAYVQFRKDYKIKKDNIVLIEKSLAHNEMRFAGTIDRVFKIDSKTIIVDLKSSSVVKKILAKIQLNGYEKLYFYNYNEPIDELWILQLKADGTYSVIKIAKDDTLFMACYNIDKEFRSSKRKKKKEKEDGTDTKWNGA